MPEDTDARVRLVEQLWNDPIARSRIEEETARLFPDKAHLIPGVQLRKEASTVLADAEKLRDETRAERLAIERDRVLERERRAIMDDPDLAIREDEIPAIEELMQKELIGSHKVAARYYRSQQQIASPRSNLAGGYSTMDVPGVNGAGGDEFSWLAPGVGKPMELDRVTRSRAAQIMDDINAGGARRARWMQG